MSTAAGVSEEADPNTGKRIFDRYWIGGNIHGSELSEVYLGYDERSDDEIIIKLMPEELPFLKEVQALERIRHERVVRMLGHGYVDWNRRYALVLERAPGIDLDDWIRDAYPHGLPIPEACVIMVQLLWALADVHDAGIVHRDLKPSNILWMKPFRGVTLIDFGISHHWQPRGLDDWWGRGEIFGTAEYTSPEQVTGELPPHPTSDIYSCGAVLYDLLRGQPPFHASDDGSRWDIYHRHVVEEPVPIRHWRPEVHPALAAVVAKALMKDPARRYQSAAEMREALEDAIP